MAKLTRETFIEGLKAMTLLEIKDLVDAMKEEFGIDPTAVAVAGPAADAAPTGPVEVSVVITSDGGNKVNVIKAVREITGLGLMEAKTAVEKLPFTVKENMAEADAEALAAKLKEAGAVVEIK